MADTNTKRRRSEIWFNDLAEPGETGVYIERYGNYGITRKELQSGRPVIGIAQSGGDLTPCNRIHVELSARVKDGIRDAGGIAFEFPTHPLQESCRRPTAALDRNLAYLGLVEILCGYPFDGVVLMTGCDKTTPAWLFGKRAGCWPPERLMPANSWTGWRLERPAQAIATPWAPRSP